MTLRIPPHKAWTAVRIIAEVSTVPTGALTAVILGTRTSKRWESPNCRVPLSLPPLEKRQHPGVLRWMACTHPKG